jgi:hypothetical protein
MAPSTRQGSGRAVTALRWLGVLVFLAALPAALLAEVSPLYGLVPTVAGWLLASMPDRQPSFDEAGNPVRRSGVVFRRVLPAIGVVAYAVGTFLLLPSGSLAGVAVMAVGAFLALVLPHLPPGATPAPHDAAASYDGGGAPGGGSSGDGGG